MIDSHAHLSAFYKTNLHEPIVKRFVEEGGSNIIDVQTNLEEVKLLKHTSFSEFAKAHVVTVAGLHPEEHGKNDLQTKLLNMEEIYSANERALGELSLQISELPIKLVGIGETGIDLYRVENNLVIDQLKDIQLQLFRSHARLAKRLNIPIVIHARGQDNTDLTPLDTIVDTLLDEFHTLPCYFHSYPGDMRFAKRIMDLPSMFGVNGIITYSGAKTITEAIKSVPPNRILLETDAPFLIPSNLPRERLLNKQVNEPIAILATAKTLSKIMNIPFNAILEQTEANAKLFFEI